ncbi:hypothetical protein D3C78_1089230 [compost metagenome]
MGALSGRLRQLFADLLRAAAAAGISGGIRHKPRNRIARPVADDGNAGLRHSSQRCFCPALHPPKSDVRFDDAGRYRQYHCSKHGRLGMAACRPRAGRVRARRRSRRRHGLSCRRDRTFQSRQGDGALCRRHGLRLHGRACRHGAGVRLYVLAGRNVCAGGGLHPCGHRLPAASSALAEFPAAAHAAEKSSENMGATSWKS